MERSRHDTLLWIRQDKDTGERSAVNEAEIRRALTGNYPDIEQCLRYLADGNELETPFAFFTQAYGQEWIR